ncbi:gluconolaconase [Fagus crenata]
MALIKSLMILIVLLVGPVSLTLAKKPHVITFRSLNLYPEGIAWDPSAQHFLVGSINNRTIKSVSDAGVVETLISDDDLPENVTVLGLSVDAINNRLLAVINAPEPLPEFNALAAYDLRERRRLFLSPLLPSDESIITTTATRHIANGVAVDFKGNAYVTNAAGNFIWKVNEKGEPSIFSRSKAFTAHPVDRDSPYSYCGLNGIAYVSKGYLLVVQSNTGKMFKVDEDDGTARLVLLNKDLILADGIAVRSDGVVLVVSHYKLWFLKSQDSWGEGVVFDEIDLDVEGFPTSVAVGAEDRVYVINGHVLEGMKGNFGREMFSIEEVRSGKESEDENIWVFALLGLGFAYLLFWRFQMRSLVKNMDKKTN